MNHVARHMITELQSDVIIDQWTALCEEWSLASERLVLSDHISEWCDQYCHNWRWYMKSKHQ